MDYVFRFDITIQVIIAVITIIAVSIFIYLFNKWKLSIVESTADMINSGSDCSEQQDVHQVRESLIDAYIKILALGLELNTYSWKQLNNIKNEYKNTIRFDKFDTNIEHNSQSSLNEDDTNSNIFNTSRVDLSSSWTTLAQLGMKNASNMVSLNGNMIMVATNLPHYVDHVFTEGIYTFDINKNEWSLFSQYPQHIIDFELSDARICLNYKTNVLYICGHESQIIKFNIKTKQFIFYPQSKYDIGHEPHLLIINDECHVILGGHNKHHLVWKDELNEFESLYEFTDYKYGMADMGIVYLSFINEMFIFGGCDGVDDIYYNKIIRYVIDKHKWITIDAELPNYMISFGFILTNDQQYIITFGGFGSEIQGVGMLLNDIYIINLRTFEIIESKIKCPEDSGYHAIVIQRERDNFIIYGYIRDYSNISLQFIPTDIIEKILLFYQNEDVYLLSGYDCVLHKINLNDIISIM